MNEFKKLTQEEIEALNPVEQAIYQENLVAWEKEQEAQKLGNQQGQDQGEDLSELKFAELAAIAKERGYKFSQNIGKEKLLELLKSPPTPEDKGETKAPSKGEDSKYLNENEIAELKKVNPTLKEFYVTSDKNAFMAKWQAENHIRNAKLSEAIQVIK